MISNVTFKDVPLNNPSENNLGFNGTFRYPDDLMYGGQGHYMLFNIYVQQISKLNVPGAVDPTAQNANAQYITQSGISNGGTGIGVIGDIGRAISDKFGVPIKNSIAGTGFGDTVNVVQDALSPLGDVLGNLVNQTSTTFNNNVVKLTNNIAIYMPDTVQFGSTASYDTQSLSGDALSMLGVGKSLVDQYTNGDRVAKSNAITALLGAVKNKLGSSIPILSSQTFNAAFIGKFGVVNPMVEVMYSKPELRNFRFDYMFYPRSESEAEKVQQIIYQFQYHQAPELKSGTAGYMLVPPSTFDIGFYYRGQVNPNIPRILSCVLKQVDVDYAPNGFHAFESDYNQNIPKKGGTGMPVGIRLSLAFQETQYVTKQFMDETKVAEAEKATYDANNPNTWSRSDINPETGLPRDQNTYGPQTNTTQIRPSARQVSVNNPNNFARSERGIMNSTSPVFVTGRTTAQERALTNYRD
jgi:hypothetical protein